MHLLIPDLKIVNFIKQKYNFVLWVLPLHFNLFKDNPMLKKILSLILALTAIAGSARQISLSDALGVASEFGGNPELQKPATPKAAAASPHAAPYYIFNLDGDKGFVIVGGDDRMPRVLGYSTGGRFDSTSVPPQLNAILRRIAEKSDSVLTGKPTHTSWTKAAPLPAQAKVLPTAEWGQGAPYNLNCPEIDGTRTITGCVATAMAIVMDYKRWPLQAKGHHDWPWNGARLDFDFDKATFDFDLMPDKFEEGQYTDQQAQEVAKLMQAAGAAVNMNYGLGASGAMPFVIQQGLFRYFGYSHEAQYLTAANFSGEDWIGMLRAQIDNDCPVITSAYTELGEGHTFVCDGYDENGLFHINWGWDGVANGFFDIEATGEFTESQGIVINIYPGTDNDLYSDVWNDYGYLWSTAGKGLGINLTTVDVTPGEPFDISFGVTTAPNEFNGVVTIALVDKDNNIVEVNPDKGIRFDATTDSELFGFSWVAHHPQIIRDLCFNSPIDDSMRLQIVAKEDGSDRWKFVRGSVEAPASCPAKGKSPYISSINFNIHGDAGLCRIDRNVGPDKVLRETYWGCNLQSLGPVVYATVDDKIFSAGNEFSSIGIAFIPMNATHNVDVYIRPYDELLHRTVTTTEAGTLSTILDESEWHDIVSLKVSGPLNADDILFICDNLYVLLDLDLSGSTLVGDIMNQPDYLPFGAGSRSHESCAWELESLKLPAGLKGFGDYSLPHSNIEYLEIPAGVTDYGWSAISGFAGAKLEFLRINNPVPAELIPDCGALNMGGDRRSRTTLIVPVGSKDAYENAPYWDGFKRIIESDNEIPGVFVDYDGCRYLIMDGYACLSGRYFDADPWLTIPDHIEYDGKKYPITWANQEFNNTVTSASYPQSFPVYIASDNEIEFNCFNPLCSVTYLQSAEPSVKVRVEAGLLHVPGACKKAYEDAGISENVQEMWDFSVYTKEKLLEIKPTDSDLTIDRIVIDGNVLPLSESGLYSYGETLPTVKVDYTLHGRQPMSTTYDPAFISAMESKEYSGVSAAVIGENTVPVYYDLNGIRIADPSSLAPGIYIRRTGSTVEKVVIR